MLFALALMFLGLTLCTFVYWSQKLDKEVAVTPDPDYSIDAEFYGEVAPFGDRSWIQRLDKRA